MEVRVGTREKRAGGERGEKFGKKCRQRKIGNLRACKVNKEEGCFHSSKKLTFLPCRQKPLDVIE